MMPLSTAVKTTLPLLVFLAASQLAALGQTTYPLRRPISPNQPSWFVHIDTWNFADPQKIIDLIPTDIRPYVIFNISMSQGQDADGWGQVDSGYETAKSWLRVCAQNKVWVIIQPSSGGYSHFSDYDLSVYEEFFRTYPNFLGINYCEQFWGFNDAGATNPSPPWQDRVAHWSRLLPLSAKYGGYLTVSWCGNTYGPPINPIGMLKRNPAFAAACEQYAANFILCEKYTQGAYQSDMESLCLGAYLSGYSGNYGIRYDSTGWTDSTKLPANFTMATAGAPHLEHAMLTGQTVIDAPELIWQEDFYEGSVVTGSDGYQSRQWFRYSQFDNMSIDLFRKIIDGTVRIPTRQELIDRTKVVVVNDVSTGSNDDIFSSPATLFEGLYRMDGDGNLGDNLTFFKKTGRYPSLPTVFKLKDTPAKSFQVQINKSAYATRWPTIAAKQTELNALFPEEYTGDIFAGRHENGWVVYNPYKTTNVNGQTASGSIPFKYNTCDRMELTLSQYASGVIKETASSLSIYLNNHDVKLGLGLRTQTIKIYGSTAQPTWSFTDRTTPAGSTVTGDWTDGVLTLTVTHNGPLDITVNCAGTATGRLTSYTPATLIVPDAPLTYTGPLQYEGEHFDYKNISGNVPNGDFTSPPPVTGYTGQGYLKFGTGSTASVRETATVLKSGSYRLETRYSVTGGNVDTVDLYVNGTKIADESFTATSTYSAWAVKTRTITLNAGANTIEYRAAATAPYSLYFDNIVVVPTAYGDGLVIQENQSGFSAVTGTIETANSGYTGTGYADSTDAAGTGIDWVLNFDSSKVKAFTFRYASTVAGTANLVVNGTTLVSNIPFPSTSSLSSWDYATVYAYVPAGTTKVRLEAISGTGLPNIDSLEVVGGAVWVAGSTPFQPVGLSATTLSTSQINLAWSVAPGATSYTVKRATTSGGPYTTIATGVTGTSYGDTGRSALTTYYYVVSATNGNGTSADSAETSATTKSSVVPVAPAGLAATSTALDVATLTWTPTPGANTYIVKRSRTSGGPYTTVAIGVTGTSFTDTKLIAGTTYYYVISAVNEMGEGANSAQTGVATPGTVSYEPIADTMVNDGSSADYRHGSDLELRIKNDGLTDTGYNRIVFLKFDVHALANAQSVTLKLTPYQVDGNATLNYELVTDDSWIETGTGGMTWNNQPAGSGTIVATASGYTVNQQKSIDITTISKSEAAGDGLLSLKVSEPDPVAIAIGFYPKEVVATAYHPVLQATVTPVYTLPATPADFRVVSATTGQNNLAWTASAAANSYNLFRATTSGGPYTVIAVGLIGTTYTDTNLVAGTTYYYRITAVNGSGESAQSPVLAPVPGSPLLANLRFDDASGTTAVDSAGRGWSGTLINAPSWLTSTGAKLNGALKLTATGNQYVSLPAGIVANLSDFTLSFWVNPTTLSTWSRIIDFSTGTTQNSLYFTPRTAGGLLRFGLRVNGNAQNLEAPSSVQLTTGTWSHVAVTLSGNTATMYINGTAVATSTTMTNRPSGLGGTTVNSLGKSSSADPYFDGAIDEFRLYGTALTAGEITALFYAATPPAAPTGLTATAAAGQVTLGWTAAPGATGYTVKRATTSGGTYATIATPTTVAYTDSGLTNGTTYYYVVTSVGEAGQGGTSSEVSALPVQTYAQWLSAAFSGQTDTAVIGATADPDSDGYSNVVEYFIAGIASVTTPPGLITAALDSSGNIVLTFRKSKNLSGLSYQIQKSTDLVTWTDTGLQGTVTGDGGSYYLMSATIPTSGATKLFVRISISVN